MLSSAILASTLHFGRMMTTSFQVVSSKNVSSQPSPHMTRFSIPVVTSNVCQVSDFGLGLFAMQDLPKSETVAMFLIGAFELLTPIEVASGI